MKTLKSIGFNFFMIMVCAVSAFSQSSNEHHNEFNFWIGEWNVYVNGTETLAGESKIESILGGKTLVENYSAANGQYKGTSLNTYNATEKRWEQYYTDNGGLVLHITGGISDGKMVLENTQNMSGVAVQNRISWTPMENGDVRQLWEQKNVGDEKWNVAFDGIYKKK